MGLGLTLGVPLKPQTAGLALATLLLVLGFAGVAHAAVTVIGGGLAADCSRAAKAGRSGLSDEQLCTQALAIEPLQPRDMAATLVNRGVMRLRRMENAAATVDFDLAIRIEPSLGEAYVNRGAAYIVAHRLAESLADLNHAIALGTEEPEKAYFNRAIAYEELDNPKAAYLDYQKALELAPAWAEPKIQLERFTVVRR